MSGRPILSRSEWPLRRVALPAGISGGLWLTEMPGRFALMSDFVSAATEVGISGLVCLVDPDHLPEASPDYAAARADGRLAMELLDFAIPDYGTPGDPAAFAAFTKNLADRLGRAERLAIHCAAGVGRTGLAAVMVMRDLGLAPDAALATIRAAGSKPENPEQMQYVLDPTHA
ncbi:protein-tyrosine phosphatase family protein [Chachezhania sediminis]|uniref:protein-tyrosine phosphatase family protein n=1 Tax=Chachezhania sediminis TaxID=2599291 RepID=UPI00131E538D|nr:tyrosine-protein phosphatase [Chachezhania sediminis]